MSSATATVMTSWLDAAALTDDEARALAGVGNAAAAADAPHLDPVDAEQVRLRHAYGHDMHPTQGLLVARDDTGRTLGYAELRASHWDNPQLFFVDLETHPDQRGRGVGDALLAAVEERARSERRTRLIADAWGHSHRHAFWERHGWRVGSWAANRRLVLADLDHARLAELMRLAEAASPDYELIELPNPAPDELIPDLLAVHLAINDSPLDDLEVDDDQWPVQRLRGFEQAMTARRSRMHRLLARRTSDGVLAGHTVVIVDESRPTFGIQEDTAVIRGHRGHRLGMRLKIAMLALLAEREPQVDHIDTWNAESNRHMIAVNDALGCVVVGRGVELQHTLEP